MAVRMEQRDGADSQSVLRVRLSECGGVTVLALIGEARVWEVGALEEAASRVIVRPPGDVVIDLSECGLMSSLAIARLIELAQVVRRTGGVVHLAAPQPVVQLAIQTLRLEQLFPIHATVSDALIAAGRRASA